MIKWRPLVEPQTVKTRCIGCNAQAVVETDGETKRRLAWHQIGNHRMAPFCSASGETISP